MADLLNNLCDVPLKKRKCGFQTKLASSEQYMASLLSTAELSLQIPQNANTSFPIWELLRASKVEVLWNVTPYKIDICIVPLHSYTMTLPQPQVLSKADQDCSAYLAEDELDTDLASIVYQPVPKAMWVEQASFYTKPYDNIKICDKFLLGNCRFGFECNQHHTPYPFHWQLRREDTYQWVSVSYSAQIKLEKLYCNKEKEQATLKEMNHTFTLDFESMTVQNSEIYDKVRRLSNTTNPEWNPYFPTVWQIYWWNDFDWEKYKKSISEILESKMEAGKNKCTFTIGVQEYELDFSSLTQKNLRTGFERRIRRRPTFRSLHFLKPYLKTVILNELPLKSNQLQRNCSVDPLAEFSSWYPPVWTMMPAQEEFTRVEVKPCEEAYQKIYGLFHKTMSETMVEIVSIQQIQNIFQWDKYRRQKDYMLFKHSDSLNIERHLFHGTTEAAVDVICKMNFDPRVAGKNGISYGRGSYFARDASYSNGFAPAAPNGYQYMFLAKVLVGKTNLGKRKYYRPPPVCPKKAGSDLYDACVNQRLDPSIFVVFDSCQCYPYYMIKYRALSDVVNVFE